MYNEDYILRLFEQIVDTAAHLIGFHTLVEIVQLNRRGDHDDALMAIDRVWDDLLPGLPGPHGLARVVDTRMLAALLREPAKLRLAVQLLGEEARAHAGNGDAARAADRYRRAMELLLEARAIGPEDQDFSVLRELSWVVPRAALAPRYRAMLPANL
jgi:hypothetical protein